MLFSYGPLYQARALIPAQNARTDRRTEACTHGRRTQKNIIGGWRHNINEKIISNTAAT